MRNECNIIKELLPLYVENMVCDDTIYFIEEHISTCEKCRNKLKSMESVNMLDENTKETINDDIINLKNFKKEWKRKNRILIRKRTILISICIFIAMAILVSNVFIKNFTETEGIHVLGKWAHINYQEKCYFIDSKTNEVIGDSTFAISGMLYDKHKKIFQEYSTTSTFSGHIEVSAYPFALTEDYLPHSGSISDEMIIFLSDRCNEPGYFERVYMVEILRSNPEVVVIHIYLENDEVLTAVCGQSEEEALENYQYYLGHFFDD